MEVSVVYTKIKDKGSKKDSDKDSSSPETGDESPLMLFLMMMIGSAMGILALRRKNS